MKKWLKNFQSMRYCIKSLMIAMQCLRKENAVYENLNQRRQVIVKVILNCDADKENINSAYKYAKNIMRRMNH